MVYLPTLTGLLLALAAAPSVLSTPIVAGDNGLVARVPEPQGNIISSLINGGGDDTSSAPSGNGGSSSNSPSASPSNSPSNSPSASPTRATPTPTPTNSPSPSNSPSNSPSRTSGPSQTSTPAQITSVPAITSVAQARTTVAASGTQSQFVIVDVIYSTTGGLVTSAATQAVPESTDSATQPAQTTTPPPTGPSTAVKVGAGVGGAAGLILILALGAVAWRIWGKNRKRAEEDDALMDDNVYGTSEVKGASGNASTGASPFQNNLEQYHNGRTNPSANF